MQSFWVRSSDKEVRPLTSPETPVAFFASPFAEYSENSGPFSIAAKFANNRTPRGCRRGGAQRVLGTVSQSITTPVLCNHSTISPDTYCIRHANGNSPENSAEAVDHTSHFTRHLATATLYTRGFETTQQRRESKIPVALSYFMTSLNFQTKSITPSLSFQAHESSVPVAQSGQQHVRTCAVQQPIRNRHKANQLDLSHCYEFR